MGYREYIGPRIFEPIGIRADTWRWFGNTKGNSTDGCCSFHTAESLARLGYLMLNNGSWDGKQLLDPSWVANVPRPARAWNGCGNYANFWWRKPIDGVPEDAYWAWGGGGEFLAVVPSLDLVVVVLYAGQLSQWTAPAAFPTWAGRQFFPKVGENVTVVMGELRGTGPRGPEPTVAADESAHSNLSKRPNSSKYR